MIICIVWHVEVSAWLARYLGFKCRESNSARLLPRNPSLANGSIQAVALSASRCNFEL
jgi:hypothetical protein